MSGVAEHADLSPRGKGGGGKKSQDTGKGVKTAKPKERFCCVTSSHSKSEYKNLSAAVNQKFAQRGRTSRHASVEVDSESRCLGGTGMASPAHGLDVCFLNGGDDDQDEYLLPLLVVEERRHVRPDMSAAEPMDPPAFKPDVQINPSEEVPVGSKLLNVGDGAQAVGGRLGVRCVTGSIIADGQVTARSQGVWLTCNDEFILDEESAGEIEEPLGDNRGFIESRDQKCVFVVLYGEQSSSFFPTNEQQSSPRMQMDRGEVEVEEARQTRVRRASILTTDKERNEYDVMRTVLRNWCDSCVIGRAKRSHRCPTSESSGPSAVRDCGYSSRSMNENSPTVLVLLRRTHGAERDCEVFPETTEPDAVDRVRVCLDAWGLSEVLFKGDSESATQALVDEIHVERSEEAVVAEIRSVCINRAARPRILRKGSRV